MKTLFRYDHAVGMISSVNPLLCLAHSAVSRFHCHSISLSRNVVSLTGLSKITPDLPSVTCKPSSELALAYKPISEQTKQWYELYEFFYGLRIWFSRGFS